MNSKADKPKSVTITLNDDHLDDVQKRDDVQFQSQIDSVIKEGESLRLHHMRKSQGRNFFFTLWSIVFVVVSAAGFGWFLLMKGQLQPAILIIVAGIAVSIALRLWTNAPKKAYIRDYKTIFMPKMAEALGGLKFFPSRGISAKIIGKTGVMPQYETYKAEDCFAGKYKGVKVILSEARLYKKNKDAVFDGVCVLLEIPQNIIEGHTIITSDAQMVQAWESTRWKKLQRVPVETEDKNIERFRVFSDNPESASLLAGERLLKELAEAADIFKNAPITAVLFRGKYIFLSIPYEDDMFEPSNLFAPVATKQHANQCKREIEQIIEIIDVFELYNPIGT